MDKLKQLVHIKQLYQRAENLSRRTDDISLIMLSQLLDYVVETFLKLVIHSFPIPSDYGIPENSYHAKKIDDLRKDKFKTGSTFPRAWDEVVGILRESTNGFSIRDLPYRRDIDRLHEIRNDVQHKGAIPLPRDLQKYVPRVESFLRDTYQDIFQKDFEKLSALSLIQNLVVKEQLEKAFQCLDKQDWTNAASEAAIALKLLMDFARRRAYANKVIKTSTSHERFIDKSRGILTSEAQKRTNQNFSEELDRLKDHIAAIGFGIDYKEYVEIELELPHVHRTYLDENIEPNKLKVFAFRQYTEEEARRIISFVEKQALEFQA